MEALNQGEYELAMGYLGDAAREASKRGAIMNEARIRNNLGLVFLVMGNNEKARKHFAFALEVIDHRIGRDNSLFQAVHSNALKAAA
jgi:tetratricopeptide (TPR) repeat protein